MVTFDESSGRLRGGKFVFEDTVVNCWGAADDGKVVPHVDGEPFRECNVFIDGDEKLLQPTSVPFLDIEKTAHFMENRKGILGLGFGLHAIRIEAVNAPIAVLGAFTYDSRPNRTFERRMVGRAVAGETLTFSLPFRARPVVLCAGGLEAKPDDTTETSVTFSGRGAGTYEIVGE